MTVYSVILSITELVEVTVVIAGELHTVLFTVTGTSTGVLNSTVQVWMEEDPAIIPGGVTLTAVGAGTEERKEWRLISV